MAQKEENVEIEVTLKLKGFGYPDKVVDDLITEACQGLYRKFGVLQDHRDDEGKVVETVVIQGFEMLYGPHQVFFDPRGYDGEHAAKQAIRYVLINEGEPVGND